MKKKILVIISLVFFTAGLSAKAATNRSECGRGADFNKCVLDSVDMIARTRSGLGYMDAAFTRDLDYGPVTAVVKASHKPKTMCVAAVSEVLIEALNFYYQQTHDQKPFNDLGYFHWNHMTALDIREYMWENSGSHSAGDAFQKFGIGKKLDFPELEPGDFLSFDRLNGGGHSVIFLAYLDKNFNDVASYGSNVVGFRYFSSQGSYTPGFAYRWAFFAGNAGANICARSNPHPDKPVDCFRGGVDRRSVVNRGGRLSNPAQWHVAIASQQLRASLVATLQPLIAGKYEAILNQSADVLRISPQSNVFATPTWKNALAVSPELKSRLSSKSEQSHLAASGQARSQLFKSPAWSKLISAQVEAELAKEDVSPTNPKFLPPLN